MAKTRLEAAMKSIAAEDKRIADAKKPKKKPKKKPRKRDPKGKFVKG